MRLKKKDSVPTFIRAMRFRLYPAKEQTAFLNRSAGIARSCHNLLLERVNGLLEKGGRFQGFFWLSGQVGLLKKEPGREYLSIAPSQSLIEAAKGLSDSFERHFEYLGALKQDPKTAGRKCGHPKFRKRGRSK